MRRRGFLSLIGALALVWPNSAGSQQRVRTIGYLSGGSRSPFEGAFEDGLREVGWVNGRNIAIEYRRAEGKPERLGDLAAELVRTAPDVIVAPGPPSRQAKDATATIPIVFLLGADPVAWGLVDSFEHPGRNLTGTMESNPELAPDRLQLLKQAAPGITQVAILAQPATLTEARNRLVLDTLKAASESLDVETRVFEARDRDQFEEAFSDIAKAQMNGLILMQSPMFAAQRQAIIDLASKQKIPAIYEWGIYAEAGGLISYGANLSDEFRRVAPYVDKILRGTKPAELPVEQPTKFEIILNIRTANTLSLTPPSQLLARAARVIE